MNLCSFLNIFFTVQSCIESPSTSVSTSFGDIIGYELSQGSQTILVFEGISYAEQLTPANRFKKSKFPTPWSSPYEAIEKKPSCYRYHIDGYDYSEDCLYLDIYTPTEIGNTTKLPVVVYLSSEFYSSPIDDRELALRLVKNGIILITIEYRQGPLGFLHLPELNIPPNLGLWDQNLALQFIHDIIPSFGGDSEKITLMGHGIGSAYSSVHTISPESRDMVAQSIQMSGTIWNIGSYQKILSNNSKIFIDYFNCSTEENEEFLDCLRNISIDDIWKETKHMRFGPTIGDTFLPFDPEIMIKQSKPIPILATFVQYESRSREYLKQFPNVFSDFNKEMLIGYIKDHISPLYENLFPRAEKEIIKQYIPFANMSSRQLTSEFLKLIDDINYKVPLAREIMDRIHNHASCFVMYWDYTPEGQYSEAFFDKGSYFGQDLAYLNGNFAFSPFAFSLDDVMIQNNLLAFFVEFIKTGNPSTTITEWPPFNNNHTYLMMKPHPKLDEDLLDNSISFWNHMNKFGKDIFTGLTTKASEDLEKISHTLQFHHIIFILVFILILF